MARNTPRRDDAAPVRSPEPASLVRPLCHEVGNLLAAIRLSAHLLRTDDPEADATERTAREVERLAAQAGAHLAQIRPLLESSPESRVRVTAGSLLRSAERAVEGEVPEGVRLRVRHRRDLPDLRVDTEALHHLLVTLLLGALETAPARGTVRLDAETQGRRVVLSLCDDGPPLDLGDARPELARGRELGVRVAAAVLGGAGGRVRVASGPRRGNRVELWIPGAGASRRRGARGAAAPGPG